jgi:hypothetical protein
MNYEIIYGEGALDRVRDLAETLPAGESFLEQVEERLGLLATNPVLYASRERSVFGFRGQTYPFRVDHDGTTYYFAAQFYFCETERELRVVNVEVSK